MAIPRRILWLITLVFSVLILTACEEETPLRVDETSIEEPFTLESFELKRIELIYTEDDDDMRIPLDPSMLEGEVPSEAGVHELTVTYEEARTVFEIELIESYRVTFKDHAEQPLKTVEVVHGDDATPPEAPTREGYTFSGWDGEYRDVQSDRVLHAQYEENSTSVYQEDFSDFPHSGSTYESGSFIGSSGVEWVYEGARGDQSLNGEKALTLQSSTDYLEADIDGSMETFSLDYTNPFSGAAGVAIYADGERLGTGESVTDETATLELDGLDLQKPFTLRIVPEPSNQVAFNNITWSGESDERTHTIDAKSDYPFAEVDIEPARRVEAGEAVTLSIGEDSGKAPFVKWTDASGDVLSESETFTHTVEEDRTFVAHFDEDGIDIDEDGEYIDPERVALYLDTYGELPGNYMPYDEFAATGWDESELRDKTDNELKSLGYKSFENREGLLPDAPGRTWQTADIHFDGGSLRGVERLVFSDDGLIYYTDDHYDSYLHLHGEE